MRSDVFISQLMNETFMVQSDRLETFLEYLNVGMPNMGINVQEANNSVTYEKIQNVAVISVDGAMFKKDMSGMCMSVASYQNILLFADMAEQDEGITKVLYRVTTPGGTAAGIDPVEQAISNSLKETVVLYEDIGASAGIYAFCGCKKRYATKATEVGSIGVVAGFSKPKDGEKITYITSSRAKNKVLDLESTEGRAKYQKKLDRLEDNFYGVVEKNTGFSSEQIQKTFNNGETIFAEDAVEAGFLHGIVTFKELLSSMLNGTELGVNPDLKEVKASATNHNLIQGESMSGTYTKESFEDQANSHAEALKGVTDKLDLSEKSLKDMTESSAEFSAKVAVFEARDANMKEVVTMGLVKGVNAETLTNMVLSPSLVDAKATMVDAMESEGAFGSKTNDQNINATAQDAGWGQILGKGN